VKDPVLIYIFIFVWLLQTDSFYFYQINFVEQSPAWEVSSSSNSHKLVSPLWNPKVHYSVHNRLLWVCILCHMNPGCT
jgi:hypothetical protein